MDTVSIAYVERGCGDAEQGGAYLHIPMGPSGIPLMDFARCPIVYIDKEKMKIKNRGMSLVKIGETWHVFDHIGSNNYPNVMDWWNEVKRFGLHTRVESTLDFTVLDLERSLYIPVHDRAFVKNDEDVQKIMKWRRFLSGHTYCSKDVDGHDEWWRGDYTIETMGEPPRCWDLLHMSIIQGEPAERHEEGMVIRKMPSFNYVDYSLFSKVAHLPGAFAAFPVNMMSMLIYDGQGFDKTVEAVKAHGAEEKFTMYRAVVNDDDGYTDYDNVEEYE